MIIVGRRSSIFKIWSLICPTVVKNNFWTFLDKALIFCWDFLCWMQPNKCSECCQHKGKSNEMRKSFFSSQSDLHTFIWTQNMIIITWNTCWPLKGAHICHVYQFFPILDWIIMTRKKTNSNQNFYDIDWIILIVFKQLVEARGD